MSINLKYTKITGHYYCQHSDDWEQDGVDFEYEVENRDLLPVVVDLLFDEYFEDVDEISDNEVLCKILKEKLSLLVDENDLVEELAECYIDTIKEVFKDEAMDWYDS